MAQKYKSKWTGPQVDSAVDQITDKIDRSEIGVAGGIASLGSDGKVPSWQLPTVKSVTADNFIGKDGITISKAADSERIEISGSGCVQQVTTVTQDSRVYGLTAGGEQAVFRLSQNVPEETNIAQYTTGANIRTSEPINDLDCTNKKYVNDGFVKKPADSPNWSCLIWNPVKNVNEYYPMDNNANAITIPYRDGKVNFKIGNLTADDDGQYCANKKYVDDTVAGVTESVRRYKHHVKFTFVSSTYNGSLFTDIYSNQNTVIDSLASLKTYLGDEFTKDLYGYLEYSGIYRLGNSITNTTVFCIEDGVKTQPISIFTISDTVTTI